MTRTTRFKLYTVLIVMGILMILAAPVFAQTATISVGITVDNSVTIYEDGTCVDHAGRECTPVEVDEADETAEADSGEIVVNW